MPKNHNGTRRQTGSHRWMFTWNNYPADWAEVIRGRVDAVKTRFPRLKWIGGEEIAPSTGTPHIQGYIEFMPPGPGQQRVRPISALGLPKEVHWGDKDGKPCKGTRQQNIDYCSKECRNVVTTFKIPKALFIPEIYGWQLEAARILEEDPLLNRRTIHWFWEPNGEMGKTDFCIWACGTAFKNGEASEIIKVGGKADDIKAAIIDHQEKHGEWPTKILVDIPRETLQHKLSYGGLEEIKSGLFFSGKYHSSMVLMNAPIIMVFANEPPEEGKWSAGRCKVHRIVNV